MKRYLTNSLLFTVMALGLVSCKKDADLNTGLVGTWKLTNRQCYCMQAPLPNETVTFNASTFSFQQDGNPLSGGNYTNTTAPVQCGSSKKVPVLQLTASTGTSRLVVATINDNTLVLDYKASGGGCISDSPVDTYQRVP